MVVEAAVAMDLEVEALAQGVALPKMSTVAVAVEVLVEVVAVAVAAVELIAHAATQETASNAAVWEILAHVMDSLAVMDLDTLCVVMDQAAAQDAAAVENIIIY